MSARTRVLIVDDSPINLKLARVSLDGEGYDVEVAADGEEAWQLLARTRPAIILMDLQLPGIDGFELTRRIKADPDKRDIKIVAVTAYAMRGDRERALAAGCDGYITKPIDPLLLPGLIASHLGPTPTHDPAADGVEPIMVVEDNPTTRKLIRVTLESEGYAVVEFGEAREAVAWLERSPARLILQDLVLPDMDGLTLLARFRTTPNGARAPILCLSGFIARMEEAKFAEHRFSAQLLKPIDPIVLLETVRDHLERPRTLPPSVADDRCVHVLVIDDDPLQRKLAEYHLSGVGFRATTMSDPTQAVERALELRPDAIISDVLMPDLNGFELCLAIRRHPRLAKLPVVLVSSHQPEDADRRLAEQVGANAFVERNGDWLSALSCVRDALSQPSPAHASANTEALREAILRRTMVQLHHQLRTNAELSQQCLLDAAQLSVLAGVADALARTTKLEGVLEAVLALCLDIAGISKGALYLQDGPRLVPKHALGFTVEESVQLHDFFGQPGLLEQCVASNQVTTIPSAAVSGELAQHLLQAAGLDSALIVRVAWGDSRHGALLLGARGADVTSHESAAFARVLGGQMGQAIGLADAFERVATSEERFRTLVSSMDDVTVTDLEAHITGVYGRVVGREHLDVQAFVGKPLRELPGPEQAGVIDQAHERARAGESVSYAWSRGTGVDTKHFQDSMWPVRNANGDVVSVVRVRRDVSEEKRLQAQVMTSDRMVSVGMLAAGVAHEINNPLMAVLGNLQVVRDAIALAPETSKDVHEALDDAFDASRRVEAIVRDLRLFSRAEDERTGAVELESVLESTLRLARNEIRHRARLVKDFRALPSVRGNDSRLGQVFLNLIVNAAQAIPEGHADNNEIRIVMWIDERRKAVVEISDTGCGIPDELAKQLFAPFVTTKPVGVGTGLGLAICQRIIQGLGGDISFESAVGRGTTFRVTLPVDSSGKSARPVSHLPVRPARRRGRIAMIDDEVALGVLMKRLLHRDHDVLTFTSAEEALAFFHDDRRFDLILCDLMMPVVSGFEFYARLKELTPELAERTVFLTGGAFTAEAREFLDRVPNEHLAKPFDMDVLRALINERVV